MPIDPLTMGGGALLIGLLGLSVGLLTQRSRDERRRHLLTMELEEVHAEATHLRRQSQQQQDRLREQDTALGQLQQVLGRNEQLRVAHQAREGEVRQQRERLEELLRLTSQQAEQLKGMQERLRQGERQGRLERDHLRRLGQLLQQLGVSPEAQPHEALALEHRQESRLALARLMADTGAEAVALIDSRGLALLGTGTPEAIRALAAHGALIEIISSTAEPSLGAPLRTWSLSAHSRGIHLLRLDGTRWLALSGPAAFPEQPMMLAMLRLSGTPQPLPSASDQLYLNAPARAESWDESISAAAADWRTRCGAAAVVLLQGDSTLLGAAPGTLPRNLAALHHSFSALHPRLLRDGWPLEETRLSVRTTGGTTLVGQRLAAGPDSPLLLVYAQSAVPDTDLDELGATLRWELQKKPLSIAS